MHVWAGPLHIPYMPRPRDRETHHGMLRNDFPARLVCSAVHLLRLRGCSDTM
jgi:hypothetical protein